jgi:hypothetical protein
VKEKD